MRNMEQTVPGSTDEDAVVRMSGPDCAPVSIG